MRVVGGRTNVWGRQSYRLGDIDFKAASLDGHGIDWPLAYKDIAPYYDIVEEYVGITGIDEGPDAVVPDGKFHPPMGMSCVEHGVRNRLRTQFGRTMTLGRSANITGRSTAGPPATTAGRASTAARRTRTSTARSPPSPTRSRPAGRRW